MKKILVALTVLISVTSAALAQTKKPAKKKAEVKKERCQTMKECKEETDDCCAPVSKAKTVSEKKP